MGKKKVLCKVKSEGKYICKIGADVDISQLVANARVALTQDS